MNKAVKIIISVVVFLLVMVGGVFFWINRELKLPNEAITDYNIVQVDKGESIQSIGAMLLERQIIRDERIFLIGMRLSGLPINYGYYQISPNASTAEVINILTLGKTKVEKVTIPEGYRLEQVARILDDRKIVEYTAFVKSATGKEGELFPDTYFFTLNMAADKVVAAMVDNYSTRIKDITVSRDDLIIASIVEREAANDTDRAIIAGIYKNRVKAGMKLQSDPTVEYGRDTNNLVKISVAEQKEYAFWKSAKTVEFTSVISPFNTYQVTGLPAGPLCNPGIASIKATLSPTPSSYYYFLYGTDGKIHPAKTQAEHEQNVQKFM